MNGIDSKPGRDGLDVQFSPEHQLLLCCARVNLTSTDRDRLRLLAGSPLNWDEVFRETQRQCIVPLLYRHLNGVCADLVSAEYLEKLRECYLRTAARSMSLAAELCAITRLLEQSGIAPLPFKGPVLALQAYGDIALRTFTDLDVLVRKNDALKACEILCTRRGYSSPDELTPAHKRAMLRFDHNLPLVDSSGEILVEVHWGVAPPTFTVPIPMDGLWDRATWVSLGGTQVRAMSPDDLLLILPVHGAKHLWSAVEWITGIAELMRKGEPIGWMQVMQRAEQLEVGRVVRLGLALAHRLLDAPIPDQVARWIEYDLRIPRLVAWVAGRLFTPYALDTPAQQKELFRFEMAVKDGPRQRFRIGLRRLTYPSAKDWQAVHIPDVLFPLYYLIRPARLFARQVRHAFRRGSEAP